MREHEGSVKAVDMKILLVEDHEESRKNLHRLIERRGHQVVSVATAEEAKELLKQGGFPFLILDWMLPGLSGIDLCRELRSQPRGDELFILLVTAKADTADLEQALAAGANDYLTKPLDIALLNVRLSVAERRIRTLLDRIQARAELQALTPSFDWNAYLAGVGLAGAQSLNVVAPEFFKTLARVYRPRSILN